MKDSLVQELQQKAEKTELLQVELQMLETERVRLSLVEEKLLDVLQLLQQLRDLVSRRHGNSAKADPNRGKRPPAPSTLTQFIVLTLFRRLSTAGTTVMSNESLCCVSKTPWAWLPLIHPHNDFLPPDMQKKHVPRQCEDMHMDTPCVHVHGVGSEHHCWR